MKNSFKHILFILFTFLVISCQKEGLPEALNPQQALKQSFTLKNFENNPELKKENLTIDWTSFIERKFDTSIFYEFQVTNESPSILNIEGYATKSDYRLLARFDEENKPEYFLVELLPNTSNTTKKPSYIAISDYSGMAYLFNLSGEKIAIESYENGVLQTKSIGNGIGRTLLDRQPSKCAILEGLEPVNCSGGGGCSTSTVTIQHWEYFYDVSYYTNTNQVIDITYSHRESRGQTTKQVTNCHASYTPSSSNRDANSIKSNPPEIFNSEEDGVVPTFANCASWEYARQSDGAKACGITGITHDFVVLKKGFPVTVPIKSTAPMYFTMPTHWTNARAQTVSAAVFNAATIKTELWALTHPNASDQSILWEWKSALVTAFKAVRGSVSGKNKHGVFRTAPFTTYPVPTSCE